MIGPERSRPGPRHALKAPRSVGEEALVVHLGAASRDVAPDDPRGWRLGGGVTFSALTTARLGLHTAALVGVDRSAASAAELELLRSAGVELRLVMLERGPVFENLELPGGRVQTCVDPGVPMPLDPLPTAWGGAVAWIVAPVAGELGDDWAGALPASAYVALGWQGLLRILEPGRQVRRRPPGPSALLDRANLVGVSRHDLGEGTTSELGRYLSAGAQLLITQGADGGRLVTTGTAGQASELGYPAIRPRREVDATGAGDAFLTALAVAGIARASSGDEFAARIHELRTAADLRFAAAVGSLVIEGVGLEGVPERALVEARLAEIDDPASAEG